MKNNIVNSVKLETKSKMPMQLDCLQKLSAREINIRRSPKRNGTANIDSIKYLAKLDIKILENLQPIQFLPNSAEPVHRWSPYVQGFSAKFVQRIINKYKKEYHTPIILDPFAGSGTVLVQSKLNNLPSYGVEINPLLHFITQTKLNTWDTNPVLLLKRLNSLTKKKIFDAPDFLKSQKHFDDKILHNLELIKSGIDSVPRNSNQDKKIHSLLLLAFSAILIDCSKLKRAPCLGYSKYKILDQNTPFHLFQKKVNDIANDLRFLQSHYKNIKTNSNIFLANSKDFNYENAFDLVITSPPYMNGLDYVMNYKIEMGWLGFAKNHKELKAVKDAMVVCDNVSKGLVKSFSVSKNIYTNEWIERY